MAADKKLLAYRESTHTMFSVTSPYNTFVLSVLEKLTILTSTRSVDNLTDDNVSHWVEFIKS